MGSSWLGGGLIVLQLFHVFFLALHDWVPLGRWNDVRAVREANPGRGLLLTTAISTAPYAFGLVASWIWRGGYPGWLREWLWWSYGLLFAGELRAWWMPYFFGTDANRVARYEAMFGRTAAVLPSRHGIRPNTLHVVLHVATVGMLVLLGVAAAFR